MSAIDDARRAQRETFEGIEAGPPIWFEGIPQAELQAAEGDRARRRRQHERLFGHPLARVLILRDGLLTVRPRGGAA